MKKLFVLAAFLGFVVSPAFAADEFGARFANQAPSALADSAQGGAEDLLASEARTLENIVPAAGEETDVPAPQEPGKTDASTPAAAEIPQDKPARD